MCFFDRGGALGKDGKLFHLWFHTGFIKGKRLLLGKMDLDKACKDKKHKKFPPDFVCELFFSSTPLHRPYAFAYALAVLTEAGLLCFQR